jgi:predicted AAA+ superfamily ATPase
MMNLQLIRELEQQNPWLVDPLLPILETERYHHRLQLPFLMQSDWDDLWILLIGPRRAGKTTLGKYLSHALIQQGRFNQLLYLNCDLFAVREWLKSPLFITEALKQFNLVAPIIFIDEVQRLATPGLLLKTIADLQLPVKLIASGSSQLEIKSKVQENLTGRNVSSLVLPLSFGEWDACSHLEALLCYGAYPQIIASQQKEWLLGQIYQDYINKDIIEFLKLARPDHIQTLLGLIAHSSGQLVNYNQLACDCQTSVTDLRHYLDALQQTYVIAMITPFVGNKRTELTSNPILYFIDNGFRNYALRNFTALSTRTDAGLLVEGLVFQELYKYITQHFLNYAIHYWRTKSGAEVDFVVYKNDASLIPIEVKYRNMTRPAITRGYRSFLQAYQPRFAVVITKDFVDTAFFEGVLVSFIPLAYLKQVFDLIDLL